MPIMANELDVAITFDLTDFSGFGAMLMPNRFDWGGIPRSPEPASEDFQLFSFRDGFLRLRSSKVTKELRGCLATNSAFRSGDATLRTFLLSECYGRILKIPEHGTCVMNTMFSRTSTNILYTDKLKQEVWAAPLYAAWHIRVVSQGDILQNYSPTVHRYIHAASPKALCAGYLHTLTNRIPEEMRASVFLGSNSIEVRDECQRSTDARVHMFTTPSFGVKHMHSGDRLEGGLGDTAAASLMNGMLVILDFFAFLDANSITHSGASMMQFIVKSEGWSCTEVTNAVAHDSLNESAIVRVCYPPHGNNIRLQGRSSVEKTANDRVRSRKARQKAG